MRSLESRKQREVERAFVLEGTRLIEDALSAGGRARVLLIRAGTEFPGGNAQSVRFVEPALFDSIAATETPQGLLGIFEMPDVTFRGQGIPLVLVLDRLTDPGNLGTAIRSAAASGVSAVVLSAGSVDPFNAKAVRAGMGAHFRVPLRWLDDLGPGWLIDRCLQRVVAEADGPISYDEVDWTGPSLLVVGSEAHGVSPELNALATQRVQIPMARRTDSLNAAVAASVILYEAARQRRVAKRAADTVEN